VKLTTHFHPVSRLRMRGSIPPLPHYVFMAWCLVEHRDIFTLFITLVVVVMMMMKTTCQPAAY